MIGRRRRPDRPPRSPVHHRPPGRPRPRPRPADGPARRGHGSAGRRPAPLPPVPLEFPERTQNPRSTRSRQRSPRQGLLAAGVRDLARRGTVVKRLSAVETLGSATVICTHKTGTLTENKMRVTTVWLSGGEVHLENRCDDNRFAQPTDRDVHRGGVHQRRTGLPTLVVGDRDPTELARSSWPAPSGRPSIRTIATLVHGRCSTSTPTGAACPRSILNATVPLPCRPRAQPKPCCRVARTSPRPAAATTTSRPPSLDPPCRVDRPVRPQGLRTLAIVRRRLDDDTVIGPPPSIPRMGRACSAGRAVRPRRPQVLDAITQAYRSGIGIHVVTGDNGLTAAEIAHRVGIGSAGIRIVTGEQLDALNDPDSLAPQPARGAVSRFGIFGDG